MEFLLLLIGFAVVALIVYKKRGAANTTGTYTLIDDTLQDQTSFHHERSGPGYYMNKIEANANGALKNLHNPNDEGPGFYM